MTAVASPPSFSNINRPAWGINGGGGQSLNSMNSEDVRGVLMPRKSIPRSNSSSSVSSTASSSSTSTAVSTNGQPNGVAHSAAGDLGGWPNTAPRKRPQGKGQWNGPRLEGTELGRMPQARPQMANGLNGAAPMSPSPLLQSPGQMAPQRPLNDTMPGGQPVLYLLSLNGTFERKTIQVPFYPETLRVGRQTNNKTVPTPQNGFFDSKVLSRQHAEIWADRQGKIWIRDVKSSNGTFVNGTRLSPENRESEPHELQSSDHLELGIDIVSEDQKSVVHHKVAAKVEHAGFLNPSNNLLDMNFGDLDPANGGMMMPQPGLPFRNRAASQASAGPNGRVPAGSHMMNPQSAGVAFNNRTFMNNSFSTELIVKKLRNEMRNARQQAQDLSRTSKFLDALLSNEDVKNQEKPEVPEPPKPPVVNGNAHSFRSDGKTRFSDPPAPPPQQPLPEKPDVARSQGDVPSLKRATTERPKSGPSSASPIRQDNLSQIIQLTEALNSAKREIDTQTSKMRDLEDMLQRERQAREAAEELAKRLEDDAHSRMNGLSKPQIEDPTLAEAFEPPSERSGEGNAQTEEIQKTTQREAGEDRTDSLQSQIDNMLSEMKGLREQVDNYKKQAEQATSERDADRKTLAEMVQQIRQRDEEAAALKAAARARTRSRSNGRDRSATVTAREPSRGRSVANRGDGEATSLPSTDEDALDDKPTLSRANTITPTPRSPSKRAVSDQALLDSIPYASMMGVVLLGMGLMAYINGWQPQPRIDR
ncbi:hypothetical protein KVR01_002253 [Diaporthe batatas]|uniref:uncharacterized protein n=1 Tax=Diaporthe batatas TaxID=748121 RepID=UPI001D036F06|nr:uncharacterized protein KVR01_002253 [Diaporthe batatas]KAG8166564.1 hypothetical protein KVR01_002253 [Diaporthe batatas]